MATVFRKVYLNSEYYGLYRVTSDKTVSVESYYTQSDFHMLITVDTEASSSLGIDTDNYTFEGLYFDEAFTNEVDINHYYQNLDGETYIDVDETFTYNGYKWNDYGGMIYLYENWTLTGDSSEEEEETTSISTTEILVVGHADVTHTFYAYPESGSSYLQYVTDEDTGEVCLRFTDTAPASYVSLSNVDTTLYKNQGFYLDSAHTISYITNGKVSGDLLPYLVNIEDENSYWQTTYPNQTHILYIYEDWDLIESEDDSSNDSTDNNDDNSTGDETTDNSSSTTKTVPVCFKIGAVDYSMYVNELKVVSTATYNKQTNANGDSFVDYINHKRTIEVGIIPLNNTIMALLLNDIDRFSVSLTFLNPQTGELETDVRCIIPKSNVEYYTIQSNKISFKAFSLSFIEL